MVAAYGVSYNLTDADTNEVLESWKTFTFTLLKGCKLVIKIQVYQLLYILDVLAPNYTKPVCASCFILNGCAVTRLPFKFAIRVRSAIQINTFPLVFRHRTADGRSRPRLLPPSRRCVLGVFGWEALNIDGTTSYYWQSGSKWESTVFCCGGCDPSTCLPLYLTCRTEFVSVRIRSFAGRA